MGLKCASYLGLFKYVINHYCLFISFADINHKVGLRLHHILLDKYFQTKLKVGFKLLAKLLLTTFQTLNVKYYNNMFDFYSLLAQARKLNFKYMTYGTLTI